VNAIADALVPFGPIPLDLPLSPSKLLGVIEGRAIAERKPLPVFAELPVRHADIDVRDVPVAANVLPGGVRIDGVWNTVLATPMGPERIVMRFETKDSVLTGGMTSAQGSMDFQGTVAGNNLKFDLKVKKPMSITLKYDLQIDGDKLVGKVKMGMFGTAKLTGERG
jgi:carbon-monoxide dehydrogenase large subunit